MAKPNHIVMVPCGCCKGSGQVSLGPVYAQTLWLLRRQRVAMNGAQLASLAECKATAMNNRLVKLEEYGLASRENNGRECLWRAT